jgi:hypothetical protein
LAQSVLVAAAVSITLAECGGSGGASTSSTTSQPSASTPIDSPAFRARLVAELPQDVQGGRDVIAGHTEQIFRCVIVKLKAEGISTLGALNRAQAHEHKAALQVEPGASASECAGTLGLLS